LNFPDLFQCCGKKKPEIFKKKPTTTKNDVSFQASITLDAIIFEKW